MYSEGAVKVAEEIRAETRCSAAPYTDTAGSSPASRWKRALELVPGCMSTDPTNDDFEVRSGKVSGKVRSRIGKASKAKIIGYLQANCSFSRTGAEKRFAAFSTSISRSSASVSASRRGSRAVGHALRTSPAALHETSKVGLEVFDRNVLSIRRRRRAGREGRRVPCTTAFGRRLRLWFCSFL